MNLKVFCVSCSLVIHLEVFFILFPNTVKLKICTLWFKQLSDIVICSVKADFYGVWFWRKKNKTRIHSDYYNINSLFSVLYVLSQKSVVVFFGNITAIVLIVIVFYICCGCYYSIANIVLSIMSRVTTVIVITSGLLLLLLLPSSLLSCLNYQILLINDKFTVWLGWRNCLPK